MYICISQYTLNFVFFRNVTRNYRRFNKNDMKHFAVTRDKRFVLFVCILTCKIKSEIGNKIKDIVLRFFCFNPHLDFEYFSLVFDINMYFHLHKWDHVHDNICKMLYIFCM